MPHTTNPVVFRLGKNVTWEILDNHIHFARSLRQQIVLNSFIVSFLDSYDFKLVKYAYRSEKLGLKIAIVAFKRRVFSRVTPMIRPFARRWVEFRALLKKRRYEWDWTRELGKNVMLPSSASDSGGFARGRNRRRKYVFRGIASSDLDEDTTEFFKMPSYRMLFYGKFGFKSFLNRKYGIKTLFKARKPRRKLSKLFRKCLNQNFFFINAVLASKFWCTAAAHYKKSCGESFLKSSSGGKFTRSGFRALKARVAEILVVGGANRARNRLIGAFSKRRAPHARYRAAARRSARARVILSRAIRVSGRELLASGRGLVLVRNQAAELGRELLEMDSVRIGRGVGTRIEQCAAIVKKAGLLLAACRKKLRVLRGLDRARKRNRHVSAKKIKKLLWRSRTLRDLRKISVNRMLPAGKASLRGLSVLFPKSRRFGRLKKKSHPLKKFRVLSMALRFFSRAKFFFSRSLKGKFMQLGAAIFKRGVYKRFTGEKRRKWFDGKKLFSRLPKPKIFPLSYFNLKKTLFTGPESSLCTKFSFFRARKFFFEVFFKHLTSVRFSLLNLGGFSRLFLVSALHVFLIRKFKVKRVFFNLFIDRFVNGMLLKKIKRIRIPEARVWLRGKRFNFFLEKQFEKIFSSNVALRLINPFWSSAHNTWFSDLYNNLRGVQSLTAKRMDLWAGYHLVISTLFAVKYKSSAFLGKFISDQLLFRGKKQQSIFLKMLRNFFRLLKMSNIYAGSLAGLSVGIYGKTGGNMLRAKRLFIRRNAFTPPPVRSVSLRMDYSLTEGQSKFGTYGVRVWISYF